jgi:polyvinyl alcohol dehydrogenase (cytochrome)
MVRSQKFKGVVFGVLIAVLASTATVFAAASATWPTAGHDLQNTRYQDKESTIKANKVANLAVKWTFTTGGDVSATPAVDENNVYFPDFKGNLFAVNRNTGALVWSNLISAYSGITGDIARTTPAIYGNLLIFGDQPGYTGNPTVSAYMMAVDKTTGALVWKTAVESVIFPIITQSALVDGSVAYVGVASVEEAFEALIPGYQCCSFRGSMLALDANTGAIKWKTYMAPAGYTGASVWGSTPVVDHSRNSLYITTGNNYSLPSSVQACVVANAGNPTAIQACISPDDHFDAVLSLDLTTGSIKWAKPAIPYDSFNVDCFISLLPPGYGTGNPGNCPSPAGPDFDFGQGAMLYTAHAPGTGKPLDFLGAGQKSGQFWALNPDDGSLRWVTQAAPGGVTGGLEWGSSTDGTRIYFASSNSQNKPFTLLNGKTINWGMWGALDAYTGAVLWQTEDPQGAMLYQTHNHYQAQDMAAVSSTKDLVFGCSMDPQGYMYAMDSSNGKILWSFPSGGSCNAGPAIVDGTVYWGSGYSKFNLGTANNKFYAFSLSK